MKLATSLLLLRSGGGSQSKTSFRFKSDHSKITIRLKLAASLALLRSGGDQIKKIYRLKSDQSKITVR